jgi:hypothetical protein
MKAKEFLPGVKFMIEGSTACIYQHILTGIVARAIVCLETNEQCNIVMFTDHFTAYHNIGKILLTKEIKFSQLTIVQ